METSTECGAKATISAPLTPNMNVKVPKGKRQRRSASSTKLIDTAVISRISVIPRVGPLPVVLIIGQGMINGEAYTVKKVSNENVKVSERIANDFCIFYEYFTAQAQHVLVCM